MPLTKELTKFSTTSPILASYDWTELASGEGYEIFYPFYANPSHGISSNVIYGPLGSGLSSGGGQTFTFNSVAFNAPRTIKGLAIASCPWIKTDANSKTVTVTIKKVSDDITTLASITLNSITGNDTWGIAAGSATITETIMAVGDILRVEIVVPSAVSISFDPVDRAWLEWGGSANINNSYGATRIMIPFKIKE